MTVHMIVDVKGNPVEGWAESLIGGGWDPDTPSEKEIAWLRAGGHLRDPHPMDRLPDGSIPPEGCLVSVHPPDCEEEWVALDVEFEASLRSPEEVAMLEDLETYDDQSDSRYLLELHDVHQGWSDSFNWPSLTEQAKEIVHEEYLPSDPDWPSRESGVHHAYRVVVALDLYASRTPVNDDEYNRLVGRILDELAKIDTAPLVAACTALQDYSAAHGMGMITCPKRTGIIPETLEDCCPYCVGEAAR